MEVITPAVRHGCRFAPDRISATISVFAGALSLVRRSRAIGDVVRFAQPAIGQRGGHRESDHRRQRIRNARIAIFPTFHAKARLRLHGEQERRHQQDPNRNTRQGVRLGQLT